MRSNSEDQKSLSDGEILVQEDLQRHFSLHQSGRSRYLEQRSRNFGDYCILVIILLANVKGILNQGCLTSVMDPGSSSFTLAPL